MVEEFRDLGVPCGEDDSSSSDANAAATDPLLPPLIGPEPRPVPPPPPCSPTEDSAQRNGGEGLFFKVNTCANKPL
jgi:hypothetical protein